MIEMHYSTSNNLQPKSFVDFGGNFKKEGSFLEATRHSPHSTSTSTLSSSIVDGNMQLFENGVDFGYLGGEKFNLGVDEWENFLSESGGNDQSLFRWIAGGVQGGSFVNGFEGDVGFEAVHQSSGIQVMPTCFSPPSENDNNVGNPLLHGSQPEQPPSKRHNPGSQFVNPNYELPSMQQSLFGLGGHLNSVPAWYLPENGFKEASVQQQQILYGELYKAMELILTRNFTQAQGILARLNHQLTPSIKPFQRSSLYFKEALQQFLRMPNGGASFPNPFDGMLKISAYKAFSEASPLIQFINFTSNQAILEAVEDANRVHIIDFDIGFGAQWSSFIQELPRRQRGPPSSLKLTAFVSPSTHHTIGINFMHGSLTQFANDVGINFELEIVNLDSFDPKFYPRSSDNEAIVVSLPIWSIESHLNRLPSLLCFIKQLSPKVVVSMERGCERFELPFPYHLLHALQYFEVLFDSLDAANMDPDSANEIERFLFQPQIESVVLGRLQSPDILPPWRNLFASACFLPVGFSNFAEAQAECVMKRTRIRGFNVEKRQGSLVLHWQHHELLTASAWRC